MKKLALISSYCNSLEKQQVLVNNLVKFEELGIDTLLFAPKGLLPKWIINKANHCIITEENPILDPKVRTHLIWQKPLSKFNTHHTLINKDYGWASLNQIKRLLSYGYELGYDIIYSTLYDLNMEDELIEIINNNEVDYFFKNKRVDGTIMTGGGIFMALSRDNCKKMSEKITLKRYLPFKSVERFLESIREELKLPVHKYITSDLIFELQPNKLPQWNVSSIDDVKVFIDNSGVHRGIKEVAVHFYDVKNPVQVKVKDLEITIRDEKVLFFRLEELEFLFTINDKSISVNNLTTFPITELKIDNNNNWEHLKKYGTSIM